MRTIISLLLLTFLCSCGTSRQMKIASKKSTPISRNYIINPVAKDIVENAREYNGVRYKYGGSTKKGMDCSGLVLTAFEKEDILLPRSSSEMAVTGQWIDLKEVQPGDLMFFATQRNIRRVNHVAICTDARPGYVEFIHSTTSKGVTTSTLEEKYWYFAFVQARRVLNNSTP